MGTSKLIDSSTA